MMGLDGIYILKNDILRPDFVRWRHDDDKEEEASIPLPSLFS